MMEHDEKIKLMLEVIMTNVEIIEKNTRGLDAKTLKTALQNQSKKVDASGSNIIGLETIQQKINDIQNSLNDGKVADFGKQTTQHHYLWFFPDLKEWLGLVKSGRFVIVLSLLTLALMAVLGRSYPKYQTYKKSHYKYQYLFYALDDQESFRNYDMEWEIDSVKALRMKSMNGDD